MKSTRPACLTTSLMDRLAETANAQGASVRSLVIGFEQDEPGLTINPQLTIEILYGGKAARTYFRTLVGETEDDIVEFFDTLVRKATSGESSSGRPTP